MSYKTNEINKELSLTIVPEEVGHPSRDNFLPIKFFAEHDNGGHRKFSRSESNGRNFWFSFVSVQRIELESIQWFDVKIFFLGKSKF